jgi:hypothetical protein
MMPPDKRILAWHAAPTKRPQDGSNMGWESCKNNLFDKTDRIDICTLAPDGDGFPPAPTAPVPESSLAVPPRA